MRAALREFSSVGFEAASTRSISARAGVRQGQLTFHFATKDELWRSTVDYLFERFDFEFSNALAPSLGDVAGVDDPVALFSATVHALVRTVSKLPELNRMMVHEATDDSDRLTWIVDVHVRRRFEQVADLWQHVKAVGATHLDTDPLTLYYCLLGAASLMYVNAPEALRLLRSRAGTETFTDASVEAHAETLVAMLLGPRTPPPTQTPKIRRTKSKQTKGT